MEKLTPLFLDSPAFLCRSCDWGAMGGFATQSLFRICRDPQTLKRFSPGCGNLEAALLHVLILNHSLCVRSASIKSLHRIGLHKANCPKKAEVCLPNGVRQSAKALQHPAGNHESHKRASAGGALKAALRLLEQHPQAQGIKRKCPFQANLANKLCRLGFVTLKREWQHRPAAFCARKCKQNSERKCPNRQVHTGLNLKQMPPSGCAKHAKPCAAADVTPFQPCQKHRKRARPSVSPATKRRPEGRLACKGCARPMRQGNARISAKRIQGR